MIKKLQEILAGNLKTYRFTWRHEVYVEAESDADAKELYEGLDLGNLQQETEKDCIFSHGHVENVSAECDSDDYRIII